MLILLAIVAVTISGCRSGKKATRNEFGKNIQMPCDEKKLRTDENFIRASQIARSSDVTLSKEKAFLVTQERLSSLLESSMRSAARRYANEKAASAEFDFAEFMESMMLGSSSITSHMLSIACEETLLNDAGVYTTGMTLEVSKEEILKSALNRQNRERYFRLEEDMDKFKQIFDEETMRNTTW